MSNYEIYKSKVESIFKSHKCIIDKPYTLNFKDGDIYPQITQDRSQITLTTGAIYNAEKFVFEFSHELTHCHNSPRQIPKKLRWIDEMLCSNMSFYVLEEMGNFNNKDFIKYLNSSAQKGKYMSKPFNPKNVPLYENNEYLVYTTQDNNNMCIAATMYHNKEKIWDCIKLFKFAVKSLINQPNANFFNLFSVMQLIKTGFPKGYNFFERLFLKIKQTT